MSVLQAPGQVLELFEMLCPLRRTHRASTAYSLASPRLGELSNLVVLVEGVRFPVNAPVDGKLYHLLTSLSVESSPAGNISLVVTALTDLVNKSRRGA
jgi:hypothetical protein